MSKEKDPIQEALSHLLDLEGAIFDVPAGELAHSQMEQLLKDATPCLLFTRNGKIHGVRLNPKTFGPLYRLVQNISASLEENL